MHSPQSTTVRHQSGWGGGGGGHEREGWCGMAWYVPCGVGGLCGAASRSACLGLGSLHHGLRTQVVVAHPGEGCGCRAPPPPSCSVLLCSVLPLRRPCYS